jgi:hypothetical protein
MTPQDYWPLYSVRFHPAYGGYPKAFFPLLIFFSSIAYGQQTSYAPLGSFVAYFDLNFHLNDPALRSLPDNRVQSSGMVRLPDGRIALLMLNPDQNTEDQRDAIYIFDIDLAQSPVWSVSEGPFLPSYPPLPEALFYGGISLFQSESLAFLGTWREPLTGGETKTHQYIFTGAMTGGPAQLLTELPVSWPYGDLGYLPSDGKDPEGFVLDPNGAPGDTGRFWITHLNGNLIREIPFPSIHLAGEASHHLVVAEDGSILALGLLEGSQSFSWNRVVCVRFDRYGEYKGMFNLGGALPTDPFLPMAWLGAMGQLSNGDMLVGTRFSDYLIDTGDANGQTYRYFVIRPPTAFASPSIGTVPDELAFPMQRETESATQTFTITNNGGALLAINKIEIKGKGAKAFHLDGPTHMDLLPSYGLSSAPGSAVDITVQFGPTSYGRHEAEVVISSNDPLEPEAIVTLNGLSVPSTYDDHVVLTPGAIDSQATGIGGVTFGNDPGTFFLILHKGDSQSQIVSIPANRNSKGKTIGFDVTSKQVITTLGHSGGPLLQSSDDILWYGTGNTQDKRIIQRKLDGTTYEQTIPFAASPGGPRDYDFGPNQSCLMMSKRNTSYLYVASLTKKTDQFWQIGAWQTHSYRGAAPQALAFWPDSAGPGDLMLYATDLVLLDGSGSSFWTSPFRATGKKRVIATGAEIAFLCRDPVSGNLLYADSAGLVHVMEGLEDYPGFSPAADFNNDDSVDAIDLHRALAGKASPDLSGDAKWDRLDWWTFGSFWEWKPR